MCVPRAVCVVETICVSAGPVAVREAREKRMRQQHRDNLSVCVRASTCFYYLLGTLSCINADLEKTSCPHEDHRWVVMLRSWLA